MSRNRDGPRPGGMIELAVISTRSDNDPAVTAESLEDIPNLHARISARGDAEHKVRRGRPRRAASVRSEPERGLGGQAGTEAERDAGPRGALLHQLLEDEQDRG